ncbi:NAD(P)/FAD-dependent oxidoreductase [Crocosphaera sp. XPORK-15E]|uniref:flavin monoamine oxidase family protein n=1 Tax=Crocosphaera sp. XPORK-15E TaxID=3110247 RepID=UPI002B20BE86|nr:NAD(P)/FAD-dependent oxidoreductase [Crocosphaera sp. XPORK-15E]MEA5533371.1 NAD(P)/FAD-dependent oxidoreductase [Crocosphaera sp. XPORK-15E]
MPHTLIFSRLIDLLNHSPTFKHLPKLTRRSFLKTAILGGGTALAAINMPRHSSVFGYQTPKIVIIGAGLAGLNAAYHLKKIGINATIYEASSRVGGRIYTVKNKQNTFDLGGTFINSDHEDMLELVKDLGIKLINRQQQILSSPYPPVAYYYEGKQWPESDLGKLLEPIAKQIADDGSKLDKDFEKFAPTLDVLSVTQYLDNHSDKIEQSVVRALLESSIRTEYGVEPENSSALQLIINLLKVSDNKVEVLGNSDELYIIEGGSSQLINQLVAQLESEQIQKNKPLKRLKKDNKQFILTFQDKTEIIADYVILAIPSHLLRQLDLQVDLPDELKAFIQEVSLGSNEKILGTFTKPKWRQNKGFTQEAWTDFGASEIWESSSEILTFYLGSQEVLDPKDPEYQLLAKTLIKQLDNQVNGLQLASTGKFYRSQWQQEPFTQGAYTNFKPGQLTKFTNYVYRESEDLTEAQNVAIDNLIFAGEQFSEEYYSYMNGAAQTGRLAAQVVINSLQKLSATAGVIHELPLQKT